MDTGISHNSNAAYDVGEIVFIEPNLVKAYKNTNKYKNGKDFPIEGSENEKWQKFLAAAYEAQSSKDTNVRVAEYFAHSKPFQDKDLGIDKMNLIQEKCAGGCNPIKLSDYNDEVNEYEYAGIFVTYSAWGGSGQARRAFHVIRREKIHTVNVNVTKRSNVVENYKEINGAKFTVKFENIKSAEMKGYSNIKNGTEIKDVSAGKIIINKIQGNGGNSNIKITFTETQAPDNYKIKNAVTTVEIKQDCSKYRIDGGDWKNTSNGATIGLSINNTPLITLGGTVWEDSQMGEKAVSEIDGWKNESARISGVLVQLHEADGALVRKNAEGRDITNVRTDTNGSYNFGKVEKTSSGYYVEFNYDGINYKETKEFNNDLGEDKKSNYGTDSKATEQDRATFNNRFKTITPGQSNDGTKLRYNNGVLEVAMDGTNPADSEKKLRVQAKTGTYKDTNTNIDCGLVKKEVDLALGTDVKEATVKINGKETNYTYAQIMDGALNFQDKSSDKSNVTYNLNLYKSDYNYRIGNYLKDGAINNIQNNGDEKNITPGSELEVYVKYNVALKNQTPFYSATVNEFEYYYDEVYIPHQIDGVDGVDIVAEKTKYNGKTYDFEISPENRKIIFTTKENGLKLTDRIDIELTFAINKESNKYKDLLGKSFEVKNAAEITSYSTDAGGLIDKDSEPGNAGIAIKNGTWNVGKYEDDSDEAKGLNISVDNNRVRKITGTVFEDTKGEDNKYNGKKDEAEEPVNDVIVQLIEVKNISGKYYEYIWQETKSGSGNVKKIHDNGKTIEDKPYREAPKDGTYEFTGYIPANYIIRYIYGDGTTYDITSDAYKDSAETVKKYNGQDYKSTIDSKYKEPWYNTAGYETGYSVARDNEARRLEVMAYSTTIDNVNGEALERRNKEDLSNTWMCAETSRINVPVDADNKNIVSDNATASYNYTKNKNTVEFNMNFGLAERPKTNLVLEKHITGLKITPNGTGVQSIVDAKANIESIIKGSSSGTVDGGTIEVDGVTQGLSTIKSTRGNRGFWQVATDVEELAQGAELEVEYTYVIRNDSEKDYLSKILVNAYEGYKTNEDGTRSDEKLGMSYQEYLRILKYDTRGKTNSYGTYLGQIYYLGPNEDGSVPNTDAEVQSRVETLEEALNNSLTFDETSGEDFSKKTTTDEEAMKTIFDTNGVEKSEKEKITTIIENAEPADILTPSDTKDGKQEYVNTDKKKTADYSKKVTLRTVLSSSTGGELGANLPSYIAEVVKYSNAAGRRDMDAEPDNLAYVHSDDTRMTMESNNQRDEFWGESIIITKPTGEDKLTPIQIAIITVSSMAVLGVGIVLIKKFVLKK